MASPYTKKLRPTSYEGTIDGISVSWSQNADQRLAADAVVTGVRHEQLKALSEHFAVLVAKSLQNSKVKIMGAPHDFTIDSTTGNKSDDALHIRVSTSGPTRGGQHNVHIYLAGEGDQGDPGKFDNLLLDGQVVFTKTRSGRVKDPSLSTSNHCENGTWQLSASN